MFSAAYYADIVSHELRGKPYNKKWLRFKHLLIDLAFMLLVAAALYVLCDK